MGEQQRYSLSGLSDVPSTLLIPLSMRARGAKVFPRLRFKDPSAEAVLGQLKEKGNEFLASKVVFYSILRRTQVFTETAEEFFGRYPSGTGINLGCGLSNYFQWLDHGQNHWIDADLPEVIHFRKPLIEPRNARNRTVEVSVLSQNWWESLELPAAQPVHVMIEGVLMYFKPQDVAQFLCQFAEKAPSGSQLCFDFTCWLGASSAQKLHPLMKQVRAPFQWGVRRVSELLPHPRLQLKSINRLGEGYSRTQTLAEVTFEKLTGVPFYAIACLGV